jgi:hypothetical protein
MRSGQLTRLILFALISFIAYLVIVALYQGVQSLVSNRRKKKLNRIAHEVLAGFDFNREKEDIKSIGSRYVCKEYRCPICNGMLVERTGIHGEFLGCNRYPQCEYTRSIKS